MDSWNIDLAIKQMARPTRFCIGISEDRVYLVEFWMCPRTSLGGVVLYPEMRERELEFYLGMSNLCNSTFELFLSIFIGALSPHMFPRSLLSLSGFIQAQGRLWASSWQVLRIFHWWLEHASTRDLWSPATYWTYPTMDGSPRLVWQETNW